MSVRVRYAPSPTGLQHIGSVRTALFNYFFARSQGGAFVLRVEDTDRERYREDALEDLFDTFAWLGVQWDEGPDVGGPHGPYKQSERRELYREHAELLVEKGFAYYAYDTPEELSAERDAAESGSKSYGYDRRFRDMDEAALAEYRERGIAPVIRFRGPLEGTTEFEDVVLGRIKKKNKDIIADPVLLKSDGYPTYHLANVIDDHYMDITHILRAQEWIPSASLHVLLYEAFGWEPPVFCHLPMVMGKDGQKLSKRHGATSALEFRRQGYLPGALMNYVSLLGWSYDDSREFFSREDLERVFSIEKINKAPAVFDYKKLDWFNGSYIRELEDAELEELLAPYLEEAGVVDDPPTAEQSRLLATAVPLVKERLKKLSDVTELLRFLFKEIENHDPESLIPKRGDATSAATYLEEAREVLNKHRDEDDEAIEEAFRARAEELGAKLGDLLTPVRVAVTGSRVSPPLFGSIRLVGFNTALERIDTAISTLRGSHG